MGRKGGWQVWGQSTPASPDSLSGKSVPGGIRWPGANNGTAATLLNLGRVFLTSVGYQMTFLISTQTRGQNQLPRALRKSYIRSSRCWRVMCLRCSLHNPLVVKPLHPASAPLLPPWPLPL